ncbi:MAG: hypothetical protein AAGD00_10780 [Planctomycetota bacterium]
MRTLSVSAIVVASLAVAANGEVNRGALLTEKLAENPFPNSLVSNVEAPQAQSSASSAATGVIWSNGALDTGMDSAALRSNVNDFVQARTADDVWFRECLWYKGSLARVIMIVSNGTDPNVCLDVYTNCAGRPGDGGVIASFPSSNVINNGASVEFPGYTQYTIEFDLSQAKGPNFDAPHHEEGSGETEDFDFFFSGEDRLWFSPVHNGNGQAFWLSSNNRTIQGNQGQFKSGQFQFSQWGDAADEICCGVCTDFYFELEGKICSRVLSQSNFELAGISDPLLSQVEFDARSADDFQLQDPLGDNSEYDICRIEAYFATNCDLSTVFGAIYDNNCDVPLASMDDPADMDDSDGIDQLPVDPVATFDWTFFEDLGITFDGLPVYRFVFEHPPVTLASGQNWWFSIDSNQGAFAGKRGIWLFQEATQCTVDMGSGPENDINLNEAHFRNQPLGLLDFTSVTDMSLAGEARDQAFSVWVCEKSCADLGAGGGGGGGVSGDDPNPFGGMPKHAPIGGVGDLFAR